MKNAFLTAVEFFSAGGGRRLSTYAAAGAYFLFISLVPLAMLVCSLLQFTPLTEESVLTLMADYVPSALMVLLRRIVAGVYDSTAGTVTLSAFLTLWSASASVKALMRGLDSVCGSERRESYIVFSLKAVGYMLLFAGLLIVSFLAMVYGGRILDVAQTYTAGRSAADYLIYVLRHLRFPAVMAMLSAFFALMYRRIPARDARPERAWPGALFASAAWVGFSWLFSLYVNLSGKFGAYGILGNILLSMMWMFFCFYFLLLGGYINTLWEG